MRIKPRFNQLEEVLRQPTQVWLDPDTGKLKAGPKGSWGDGSGWAHLALGHALGRMAMDTNPFGNLYGCVWNEDWASGLLYKATPGDLSPEDVAALNTIALCHQVVTTRRTLNETPTAAWQVFNYNTAVNPFWARNYRLTAATLTAPQTLSISWMNGYASVGDGMPGVGIAEARLTLDLANVYAIPEPAAGVVVPVVDVDTGDLILPTHIHAVSDMGDFHDNGETLDHFTEVGPSFTLGDRYWIVGRLQTSGVGTMDPLPDFAFDIWPKVVVVG